MAGINECQLPEHGRQWDRGMLTHRQQQESEQTCLKLLTCDRNTEIESL